MHALITKLLAKRGIKTVDELSEDEKQTFENWKQILSKDTLTVEDIQFFCKTQLGVIEGRWRDYAITPEQKSALIPYHTVYKLLLEVIDSPKTERKTLENQLNQLINS